MSDDLLRRAAKEIRADSERLGGSILPRSLDYNLAVADWLEREADLGSLGCLGAVAAARAYLGESS